MLRFIADEDLNGRIIRGLYRRQSGIELVRVQDLGLSGASDEKLLEWATDNDRIVLTMPAPCPAWQNRIIYVPFK